MCHANGLDRWFGISRYFFRGNFGRFNVSGATAAATVDDAFAVLARNQLEIFNAIVRFVAIFMMDGLMFF